MMLTAESVSAWHPDKICDQISDGILDECLKQDPYSRVAVETLGGHGKIYLVGEITTKAEVDFIETAKKIYFELTREDIEVFTNIVKQAPEISMGVDSGGAGDQGIMVGYACNENEEKLPHEMYLARDILKPFGVDAKSQVTTVNGKPTNVILSVQGKDRETLFSYLEKKMGPGIEFYCNNTGSFDVGGFEADSGCTGRKIVVDAYGPRVPVGGGAFSGKDATKVDRSAAYMARWIALTLLKKYGANEVLVKLAYVIGGEQPLMAKAIIDGKDKTILSFRGGDFDCRPQAIIERFDLRKPIYRKTARRGHFGIKEYPWEQV